MALECARRAVWGMMYADDVSTVARLPRRLELAMALFIEVFGAFGLAVSENKRKIM